MSRIGIFSSLMKCSEKLFYSWVKSQSKDTFNEHLDHVIPIKYF
jgi:ribonuclease HI